MNPFMRTSILLLPAITGGMACQWFAVSYNAINYPTTEAGETANVIVAGDHAYGTLAEGGLEVVNLADRGMKQIVAPPPGSESIDDITVADGLLFALDAREPGYLSVFSVSDSAPLSLVSGPIAVPVGPFSGVSAANGVVVVSGGTSMLTLFHFDTSGHLSSASDSIDLGRGQPDVLVAPDGGRGFVSTHYFGPNFGLTTLRIGDSPRGELSKGGSIDLDTYGFTDGGAKPANFPIEAALRNNTLYVAESEGLAVISVDTLDHPRLLSVVDIGVKGVNVDVFEDRAVVVGSSPKPLLVLLDVTEPTSPVIRQTVPLPEGTYATSVSIGPEHIAVGGHKRGLLLFHYHNWSVTTGKEKQ